MGAVVRGEPATPDCPRVALRNPARRVAMVCQAMRRWWTSCHHDHVNRAIVLAATTPRNARFITTCSREESPGRAACSRLLTRRRFRVDEQYVEVFGCSAMPQPHSIVRHSLRSSGHAVCVSSEGTKIMSGSCADRRCDPLSATSAAYEEELRSLFRRRRYLVRLQQNAGPKCFRCSSEACAGALGTYDVRLVSQMATLSMSNVAAGGCRDGLRRYLSVELRVEGTR